MNYGYIRVSTEEQNLDNQKLAISQQYHVDYWAEEKRSGTLDYKKHRQHLPTARRNTDTRAAAK